MHQPPGTILVLNGTSSSGKSSLLRALQDSLAEPYLEAGLDKFIWMLPRRYLDRPLWDDVLGLADQAGESGHRLVTSMHLAIAALARSGQNVLADHVLVEPAWVQHSAQVFAGLPAYLIGVHCPLEVLEQRERARRDRTLGQARAQFGRVHAHGCYDLEVDTAREDVGRCVARIKEFLASGRPATAFEQLRAAQSGSA